MEEDTIDNTVNKYQLINEDGTYTYTRDLQELEQKRPAIPPLLPILGKTITSPLVVHNWSAALEKHPDQKFVHYILQGLTQGFHIGFNRELKCRPAKSALQNSDPVDKYLAQELQAGRVVGPLDFDQLEAAQVSLFGVIPKAGQPEKWRLTVDLSSPRECSVNDGINKDSSSLICVSGRCGTMNLEHAWVQNTLYSMDTRLECTQLL